MENDSKNSLEAIKIIGIYRFIIDGTMILTIATMLWTVSSWKTSTDISVRLNRENAIELAKRVEKIEEIEITLMNQPITREADSRLNIVETAMSTKFDSIERRLQRIENLLEKNHGKN